MLDYVKRNTKFNDARSLMKTLGISQRTANALVNANFKSAKAVALLLGSDGYKLALMKNIGEKSCQEIAWGLWKNGYLTYRIQAPRQAGTTT